MIISLFRRKTRPSREIETIGARKFSIEWEICWPRTHRRPNGGSFEKQRAEIERVQNQGSKLFGSDWEICQRPQWDER